MKGLQVLLRRPQKNPCLVRYVSRQGKIDCHGGRVIGQVRRYNILTSLQTCAKRYSLQSSSPIQLAVTNTNFIHGNWNQKRFFNSEADYHTAADEALEMLQDSVEAVLEENGIDGELSFASGVLTISLPPHGTWVLNKQTPNQQIWWSSPVSGPRRYEYDEETEKWVFTRDGAISLGTSFSQEFQKLYNLELDLDDA